MGFGLIDALNPMAALAGNSVGSLGHGIAGGLATTVNPGDIQGFVQPQMIHGTNVHPQQVSTAPFTGAVQNLQGYANNGQQANTAMQQQQFVNALQSQAMGLGPSPSATMFQQAAQQNASNAAGLAASQRGVNPGLALRQAQMAQAQGNQQAAGQAALGRQQEQLNAQGMWGNALSGIRSQDIQNEQGYNNLIQGYQGMGLQAGLANMGANLQGQLANQGNNFQSQLANQQAGMQSQGFNTEAGFKNAGFQNQIFGGLLQGGGAAAAAALARGGEVPGQAPIRGDSPKNDTVPAMLSPHEIVIPRSITTGPDAAQKAKEFVIKILSQRKNGAGAAKSGFDEGGDVTGAPLDAWSQAEVADSSPTFSRVMPSQGQWMSVEQEMAAAPQAAPANPPQAAPVAQASSVGGLGGLQKEMQSAEQLQLGAASKSAQAESKAQEGIAQAYAGRAVEELKRNEQMQAKLQVLDQEHNALIEKFQNGQVDPHRALGSTGAKISAAIGLILGGIGSGITGQPNVAAQIIDNAINRDIDAQKANLGKTQSLLNMNMERYHNLYQAEAATRLQMLGATQALVSKYQAQAGSAEALARGQMLQGQIKQQYIPLKQGMIQSEMVGQLASGGGQGLNMEYLPEKVRERTVYVPGANRQRKLTLAKTKEEAGKFNESESEHENLEKQLDDALAMANEREWSPTSFTERGAKSESIRDGIILSLNKLHGLNRLTDNEFKVFEKMVPNPGQLYSAKAIAQLEYLKGRLAQARKASYANSLDNYNPGSIQESAPKMGGR